MPNYLLTAGGTLAGGQPWSIRSYAVSSSTESVTATAWDAAFGAFWNTASWIALLPTTTVLTFTSASTMTANFHQSTKTTTTRNNAGTSAGAALPSQIAIIATFRTALASRAGRGRWYLPAPSASGLAATGNLYAAATMTALQTGLNAMGGSLGGNVTLQILHRNATKSGLGALTLTPVATADCSNKPAVQRRRGDKIVPTRTIFTP